METKYKSVNDTLVVLVKDKADWLIIQQQNWYRIPIETRSPANLRVAKWIAFYFPQKFGDQKYSIRYYATIIGITECKRFELFPNEPQNSKSLKTYHKIQFQALIHLPKPIVSHKGRLLLFIPTTLEKLFWANEINDIFNDSPLEEKLWLKLKQENLSAERQFYVKTNDKSFICDFVFFCKTGIIDVECDGEQHQTDREQVIYDKIRNNEIEAIANYNVLRFTTHHINFEMNWTISMIKQKIDKLGGIYDEQTKSFRYTAQNKQLGLFD